MKKYLLIIMLSTVLMPGFAQKKDTLRTPPGFTTIPIGPVIESYGKDSSNPKASILRVADGKGKTIMEVTGDSSIIVLDSAKAIKQLVDALLINIYNDRRNYEELNAYTNLLMQIDKFCDCSKNINQKEFQEAIRALQEVRKKYIKRN